MDLHLELKKGVVYLFGGGIVFDVVKLVGMLVAKTPNKRDDVLYSIAKPLLEQANFSPERQEELKLAVERPAVPEGQASVPKGHVAHDPNPVS